MIILIYLHQASSSLLHLNFFELAHLSINFHNLIFQLFFLINYLNKYADFKFILFIFSLYKNLEILKMIFFL